MKVSELEVGVIYNCRLSNQKVLVIQSERVVSEEEKEEVNGNTVIYKERVTEKVIAGKVLVEREGMKAFSLIELHDGQLEVFTK